MQTIDDVRRDNVLKLIADEFDGVTNRLAKKVGVKHHVISRCLKPDSERKLGVQLVRKIEEVCGLESGFLDTADEVGIQYANKLAERFDRLPPDAREHLLNLLDLLEKK